MNSGIQNLRDKFETYGDEALTYMIITVALIFIGLALVIHNPYIKALMLAYIILP